MSEALFATDDAAEILGIPPTSFVYWIRVGAVSPTQFGSSGRSHSSKYSPIQMLGLEVAQRYSRAGYKGRWPILAARFSQQLCPRQLLGAFKDSPPRTHLLFSPLFEVCRLVDPHEFLPQMSKSEQAKLKPLLNDLSVEQAHKRIIKRLLIRGDEVSLQAVAELRGEREPELAQR